MLMHGRACIYIYSYQNCVKMCLLLACRAIAIHAIHLVPGKQCQLAACTVIISGRSPSISSVDNILNSISSHLETVVKCRKYGGYTAICSSVTMLPALLNGDYTVTVSKVNDGIGVTLCRHGLW